MEGNKHKPCIASIAGKAINTSIAGKAINTSIAGKAINTSIAGNALNTSLARKAMYTSLVLQALLGRQQTQALSGVHSQDLAHPHSQPPSWTPACLRPCDLRLRLRRQTSELWQKADPSRDTQSPVHWPELRRCSPRTGGPASDGGHSAAPSGLAACSNRGRPRLPRPRSQTLTGRHSRNERSTASALRSIPV